MAQPYAMTPPANNYMAYQMMARHLPMDMVQSSTNGAAAAPNGSGVVQASYLGHGMHGPASGLIAPPGAPFGPPPLVLPGNSAAVVPPPGMVTPPGAVAAVGALTDGPPQRFPVKRTQVRFVAPSGMKVAWLVPGPDGRPTYSPAIIEAPGRYNFGQAAIYRLKLSNIEGRPGLEIYPTLEVVPANTKTEAFLAHSAVPVEFTDADFNQIAAGNYVVKVIYLPDPQFQELAATGIGAISSTQLEPGLDPIVEALRRGCILLVLRMGNMDQEAPNTPPIDAPSIQGHSSAMPHGMMPGPGPMVPYGMGMPGGPMMPPGPLAGATTVPAVPPALRPAPTVPAAALMPVPPQMVPPTLTPAADLPLAPPPDLARPADGDTRR
jgi:hypothetical protein